MSDTRLMPESASKKSTSTVDELPRFSGLMVSFFKNKNNLGT